MRRETWEETGIEVGEVIYHSSQPWPGIVFTLRFTVIWILFQYVCFIKCFSFDLHIPTVIQFKENGGYQRNVINVCCIIKT